MNDKWARLTVAWSRRGVIAVVIVGLLGILVPVALFFYGTGEKEIPTKTVESLKAPKGSPRISISSIHLSQVAMDVAAAFELVIQADSISNIPVRETSVILDFGRAEVESCGYVPKRVIAKVFDEDKSHRRFKIAELGPEEKLYIRCLISSPVFSQVLISGGNVFAEKSMNFDAYKNYTDEIVTPFFEGWYKVVTIAFTVIFFLWLWRLIFS